MHSSQRNLPPVVGSLAALLVLVKEFRPDSEPSHNRLQGDLLYDPLCKGVLGGKRLLLAPVGGEGRGYACLFGGAVVGEEAYGEVELLASV